MKRIQLAGYRRSIIGIVLVVIACSGLIAWEVAGRDVVLMDEVVVAKVDIRQGAGVTKEMVTTAKVLKENVMKDAVSASSIADVYGEKMNRDVSENGQISMEYLKKKDPRLGKYQSIFVIKGEWIDMRSSALRRGDKVKVFASGTGAEAASGTGEEVAGTLNEEATTLLGVYEIAFVKDSADREVLSVSEGKDDIVTERQDSSAVIDHIEVICTLQEYNAIREHGRVYEEPGLTLVHDLEV